MFYRLASLSIFCCLLSGVPGCSRPDLSEEEDLLAGSTGSQTAAGPGGIASPDVQGQPAAGDETAAPTAGADAPAGPPAAGEAAPVEVPEEVVPEEGSSSAIQDVIDQIAQASASDPVELAEDAPQLAGDLVISEYIPYPDGALNHEWIEIYNPGDQTFNLRGCELTSFDDLAHVVETDVSIGPKEYVLLVRNENSAVDEELDFVYIYARITMENGDADSLELNCGDVEIDGIVQQEEALGADGEPLVSRTFSVQLDTAHLNSGDNDALENWCRGVEPFGPDGDNHGTPGRPNVSCQN